MLFQYILRNSSNLYSRKIYTSRVRFFSHPSQTIKAQPATCNLNFIDLDLASPPPEYRFNFKMPLHWAKVVAFFNNFRDVCDYFSSSPLVVNLTNFIAFSISFDFVQLNVYFSAYLTDRHFVLTLLVLLCHMSDYWYIYSDWTFWTFFNDWSLLYLFKVKIG